MSRFSHYGSGQRLAFAMLCVGFGLCLAGAIAPFWLKAEVKMSDVSFGLEHEIPVFGDFLSKVMNKVELLKVNLGVWVFCLDSVNSETKCYSMYNVDEGDDHDTEDHTDWIQMVRIAVAVNIKLSLLCGLIACCRCLCCSGGRTICHGLLAFLAGGSGLVAVAIMASRKKDLVSGLQFFMDFDYDWAFFIYIAGCGFMVLSSFFLCFSVPNETPNGVVMMQMPAAGPYIAVNSTNQHTVMNTPASQYEFNGQIQGFEPLPQPMPQQTVDKHPPPPY